MSGASGGAPRRDAGELMRLKLDHCSRRHARKTTTTSMVAAMLDAGGIDPTVINGGIINAYWLQRRLGSSNGWWSLGGRERRHAYCGLDGTIAVVTNIDPEHLEHYGSFDKVKDAFVEFVENVPFYGAALLCVDHPECRRHPAAADRRHRDLRLAAQADVRGENAAVPGGNRFDVSLRDRMAQCVPSRVSADAGRTMSRTRWRDRRGASWVSPTKSFGSASHASAA
jgi:UDP-N-acetylmuramate--alanine ligase